MKKISLILLFIIYASIGFTQNGMMKIHDNLANKDGVLSFSFGKNSISDLFEEKDSKFEKLKILYSNAKDKNFVKKIMNELKKQKYKKIDEQEDEKIKIFTIGNKKHISELHLIYNNEPKTCLISIYGKFKNNREKELTKVAKESIIN